VYTVVRTATSPRFKGTDFFETSAMHFSFILLGKYLEVLAKGKTSEAISKLMDLAPDTATLLTLDDQGIVVQEREISSQLIQRRDIIKVQIKMKFLLDHPLLELSSNGMGLSVVNWSPTILHWLVCIHYQLFLSNSSACLEVVFEFE
jgi:cation transport ATPase